MTTDLALFIGLALIAIVSAVSMLVSRNAVYSALFLVLNFLTVAMFYLLLHAAFIAMVQITVYAGAIMVLFLFVIMLLGTEREEIGGSIRWQMPVAIVLAVGLAAELVIVIFRSAAGVQGQIAALPESFGSPASIGRLLFSEYLVPFEAVSILLLVAMIGTIVLTLNKGKESR
ncbi:MAG: NADH-quinone oxidoreductase subunit J [Anaerolineales bacterium]|nr:NADH-quinone oxidoreductase subunit J [Anaerolineales bacterium]